MKKILLPTDFSANSWEATLYALKLFKDKECAFYIMHSLEPLVSAPSTAVSSKRANEAIIKSRLNESKLELKKELEKIHELPKNDKHRFETVIAHDYFLEAVKTSVKKLDIDIVVVGTKGASGIKEMTIGSNTANLINKQTCPIIAVPQDALSNDMSEIGFATDLSISNYGHELDLLKEIATSSKSKIAAVHVINKKGDLTTELLAKLQALEATLKPLEMDFYLITDVSVEVGTRVFSESRKLGMLCIINKKRSFFEKLFSKSNSKSISSHLNVPLIIFNHESFK
ncbi:universal stress protein [Xanthomarina sp. F2636L]|uniref:universal stress protein n=1 Tax=Xanthomarina sp. F2636L TaxID=2996018 RepID=UPI00225E3160|nr:universal stress protein [Xanthomarina sp. F2636L]MCX7549681.1 universal stress protein [Xanthomarina sp. F2636L]